jgi:D-sedoheptulose 7-phosphate isomerase
MKRQNIIESSLKDSATAMLSLIPIVPFLDKFAQSVIETFDSGNKIIVIGNGGSAADAQHFATEMVVRYKKTGIALPAIALTTDTSILTATGNDINFDQIFARQVEALGRRGDMLLAISTSGNSRNILRAAEVAKNLSLFTVALTGKTGGRLSQLCHMVIKVPQNATSRVQEAHIAILHAVCEVVESQKR